MGSWLSQSRWTWTSSRAPDLVGRCRYGLGYSHSAFAVASLAEFKSRVSAIRPFPGERYGVERAVRVEAGIGELSRLNKLVTPEFGPRGSPVQGVHRSADGVRQTGRFRLVEFCKRCKKCAEACPSGALSFDDEPSFKTRGPWNNPGHKAWFEDFIRVLPTLATGRQRLRHLPGELSLHERRPGLGSRSSESHGLGRAGRGRVFPDHGRRFRLR